MRCRARHRQTAIDRARDGARRSEPQTRPPAADGQRGARESRCRRTRWPSVRAPGGGHPLPVSVANSRRCRPIRLRVRDPGRVVITAEPNDTHLNPAGTVHGGFSATLLDSCMRLAILSTLEKGVGQTTLEFKISLVRPITTDTGPITAEGVVLSRGRRVGTAEGRITDSKGRLLVHGTTTCLIFER